MRHDSVNSGGKWYTLGDTMKIGYARVSSTDQDLSIQIETPKVYHLPLEVTDSCLLCQLMT